MKDLEVLELEFEKLKKVVLKEARHDFRVKGRFAKKAATAAEPEVKKVATNVGKSLMFGLIDKGETVLGSETVQMLKDRVEPHLKLYGYTVVLVSIVAYIAWQWYKMNYKIYADRCREDSGESVGGGVESLKNCILKGKIDALGRGIKYMLETKRYCSQASDPQACFKKFDERIQRLKEKQLKYKKEATLF